MKPICKKVVVCLLALPMLVLGATRPLSAEIIGTLPALDAEQRDRDLETVNRTLASEQVSKQLAKYGVEKEQVDARVAALTDDELHALARRASANQTLMKATGMNNTQIESYFSR